MERARSVLVTGATDGIGLETARRIAANGRRVLLHGRDRARVERTLRGLDPAQGEPHLGIVADFASLGQVRGLAAEVSNVEGLCVLINNAGVYSPRRRETQDGWELTFQVNHLAHYLLTRLLARRLSSCGAGRVVTIASGAHRSGTLDFSDLMSERSYHPYGAYAASKLANVMFCYALARRWDPQRLTSTCMNPGPTETKMLAAAFPGRPGRPAEDAARVVADLALAPDLDGVTGRYFEFDRPARSSAGSYDQAAQERLWETSARLVGVD